MKLAQNEEAVMCEGGGSQDSSKGTSGPGLMDRHNYSAQFK